MAQSFGDLLVLLDDDVIPDTNILTSYVRASKRFPSGKIFVGTTKFPPARTMYEKALVASQMTYFYDIASKMKHPPWGVTANLCIRGRFHPIWFSDKYPKTGGGEDIDFCIRTKNLYPQLDRNSIIVSVPDAQAVHPYWNNILKQIMGWAVGDSKCLTLLPHSTFYAFPNWIEWILLR